MDLCIMFRQCFNPTVYTLDNTLTLQVMVQTILEMKWNNVTIVNDNNAHNKRLGAVLHSRLEKKGICHVSNVSVENSQQMDAVVIGIFHDRINVVVYLGSSYMAKSLLRTMNKNTDAHKPVVILSGEAVLRSDILYRPDGRFMEEALDTLFIFSIRHTGCGFHTALEGNIYFPNYP